MASYGQFCPMSKAMELLDERWTMLVVRELLLGSTHFNQIRRGVPKMSPALLSKRLQSLTRAGVVARAEVDGRTSYTLTPCGAELGPIVQALNAWGVRWIGDLGDEDLDPHLLMWDMHRTMPVEAWPRARTVLEFRLSGVANRRSRWWLMVSEGQPDVCDFDPGYEIAATVETGLRTLTEIWRGDTSWSRAINSGVLALSGSADARRSVPTWLGQAPMAAVPRPT